MGKATSGVAALTLLLAAILAPLTHYAVHAQSLPPVSCSGQLLTTPMQGHYTGQWHSDGDYHFLALGHDIELKITIDGTLDVMVGADGRMTGTVQGNVDAPLTHDGQRDVSSGTGTISGTLAGLFAPSGSVAVLTAPVILMHWGTFVGGGYTADRYITMPDYQFPIAGMDCVSAHGAIAENNFPEQYIVADFQGQEQEVPGIGVATGSWQITSDRSAEFQSLSQQVDAFITRATAFLAGPSALQPDAIEQNLATPLKSLKATIRQDPDVARCLMDRLGAWESSVLAPLLAQVNMLAAGTDLSTLRRGGDTFRAAHLLNLDCSLDETAASNALMTADRTALDRAIAARSWSDSALWARELLLLGGDAGRATLQQQISRDLHVLVQPASGAAALLEIARVAYVLGDDADSTTAMKMSAARTAVTRHVSVHKKKKRKKKKVAATPTPTATATPPPPKPLEQQLSAGIAHVQVLTIPGAHPILIWQPAGRVARYVVAVRATDASGILWAWSGTGTSVTFGDTSLDGVAGSGDDVWPLDVGSTSYTWSVLELDGSGRIVGASFGAKP
jgi:hypothetical protein